MNPQPTRESLAACYPSDYGCHIELAEQDVITSEPPPASRAVRAMKWVPGLRTLYRWLAEKQADVVPPVQGQGRALEFGCGRGEFLRRLQCAGWSVVGVDLVEQSVQSGIARGFDVRHGTLAEQQFPAESFDAIAGWMVLEHTPDPCETIRECRRLLSRDGQLLLSVPNFAALERRVFGPYWCGLELPRHLQHFSPSSLRRLLESEGFQVVSLVHQRNAFNLVWSLGLWMRERTPFRRTGQRLISFVDNPSMRGELALAPLAKLLGVVRQSGRMTVVARKRSEAG